MTLPSQFVGTPASVSTRILAFSIDAAIVLAISLTSWAISGSLVFAGFLTFEALLALWILQANTGAGPGKALLGLRVARVEAPFSPGSGRSFVRGSLILLGGIIFAAGAWVVQGSAAWDRSGLRRSWADYAAQTVVVLAPRRSTLQQETGDESDSKELASPIVVAGPRDFGTTGRSHITRRANNNSTVIDALHIPLAPKWGAPMKAKTSESHALEDVSGELLLIFDTGQRAQFSLPVAINLGRDPEQTEPTDAILVVSDPDSSVSKSHVRLEHDRSGTWITDIGSTNGTDLIDEDSEPHMLSPHARTYVDEGTRIRMGNRVFTVSRLIGDPS
ncbi:putative RDD family membrane protein YckC [Microbacterium halimionae]|uniref:Putative RDD family membrane protein YckC n=1 Tax=Microbacterium halimionae TaxID=1526413 RepID=A0A7W3JLL1_9MICO|nr:RDD family protein [Microbacterium halimionae]MBA8815026.1 putative RDD family membrane protein YckC [Microbacterium halimionae]NII94183.1 putative RDD family membrane protein YckC [Microbacterium halimionae]